MGKAASPGRLRGRCQFLRDKFRGQGLCMKGLGLRASREEGNIVYGDYTGVCFS